MRSVPGCVQNRPDRRGWTPLHRASAANKMDCIAPLLKAKADPNLQVLLQQADRAAACVNSGLMTQLFFEIGSR